MKPIVNAGAVAAGMSAASLRDLIRAEVDALELLNDSAN